MTRKVTVCAASAAFFGAILSAFAGEFYPSEITNATWAVGVSTMETLPSASPWDLPDNGEANLDKTTPSAHRIVFDTDQTDPLVYTPTEQSGRIAFVNVTMKADPNADVPSTAGLSEAQAALSVVTNAGSGLYWVGLVKDGATNKWVSLTGASPVSGQEYEVEIALNNNDHTIRYSVKDVGAASYTVLQNNSASWLANPKENATHVSAVAFAGAGSIGDFGCLSIGNGAMPTAVVRELQGYDFTNGTVRAVVTLPEGSSRASSAILAIKDSNGTVFSVTQNLTQAETTISWDISEIFNHTLAPGAMYDYTVTLTAGESEVVAKRGEFIAAAWSAGCWFGDVAYDGTAHPTNGAWDVSVNAASNRWDVAGVANFSIDDKTPGSNAVTRVDTKYAFETFTDVASLDVLNNAVGGIVAVEDEGGKWYAFTGADRNVNAGWVELEGVAIPPASNTEYVVRAEFDFYSSTHRVRYFVSSNNGATFEPLTAVGGADWLDLADQGPAALSSVGMSGRGYVKSISARLADPAVVQDSQGNRFATIWDAIKNGRGPFTLLTNATLAPNGTLVRRSFNLNLNGFGLIVDESGITGGWRLVQVGDTYYLIKNGATYIFF